MVVAVTVWFSHNDIYLSWLVVAIPVAIFAVLLDYDVGLGRQSPVSLVVVLVVVVSIVVMIVVLIVARVVVVVAGMVTVMLSLHAQ